MLWFLLIVLPIWLTARYFSHGRPTTIRLLIHCIPSLTPILLLLCSWIKVSDEDLLLMYSWTPCIVYWVIAPIALMADAQKFCERSLLGFHWTDAIIPIAIQAYSVELMASPRRRACEWMAA